MRKTMEEYPLRYVTGGTCPVDNFSDAGISRCCLCGCWILTGPACSLCAVVIGIPS